MHIREDVTEATASPRSDGENYAAENRLRAMAVAERPQERLERLGPGALSDAELIAVLLRSGTKGHDIMTLSARLIADAGSLGRLITWKDSDFKKLKGIGPVKSTQLIAVVELARRVISQSTGEAPILGRAELVAEFLQPVVVGLEVEKFWVLCLNRKNRLLRRVEITSGTATNSLVHPREVFREAIREGAAALICAHNHPSGDPAPSAADIQVTRQLREAAKTVCIDLLDHVILGSKTADPTGAGFYSFRSAGLL
jgi:DNA repair protein RadC